MPRYIAHLIGHPASVEMRCACTRVRMVKAHWLIEKLGLDATIESAAERLICNSCKTRPVLRPCADFGVSGGRDMRVDPDPMPAWVDVS